MDVNDDYMCPNCVTPWKCNGPHVSEDDCTCKPGTHDNGWHEARCEPCLRAELAAWSAAIGHGMSVRRGI